MKKIDYFASRTAVIVTWMVFVSQCIVEVLGARKPGYEWVFIASGCAFTASLLWAIGCILWNALRSKHD
jgi:hypothetical protein